MTDQSPRLTEIETIARTLALRLYRTYRRRRVPTVAATYVRDFFAYTVANAAADGIAPISYDVEGYRQAKRLMMEVEDRARVNAYWQLGKVGPRIPDHLFPSEVDL